MYKTKGLTLVELTVAMAMTSVIGLAVAGVAIALSVANAHGEDYDQSIQSSRVALMRIDNQVRASALIVSSDWRRFVLWTGDANGNGKINYNELAVISYDTYYDRLRQFQVVFGDACQEGCYNSVFWLRELSNAATVESWIRSSSFCRTTILATDVTNFSFSLSPAPPLSKLVSVDLTVGQGPQALTASATASLRADWTSHVFQAWGEYYLDTE
ncbi:MAG: PilW family protein [Planctomycetota bacterium]|jgi:hypothetical protein